MTPWQGIIVDGIKFLLDRMKDSDAGEHETLSAFHALAARAEFAAERLRAGDDQRRVSEQFEAILKDRFHRSGT